MSALTPLRPYQQQIARAILERVLQHRGGSISVEVARQGGKNEVSARVELALLLAMSTRGGTLVKCAPTFEPQARISLRRLQARARDASLGGAVRTRDGAAVQCGRAEARFLSAEPHASVVGHTADVLLEVDEAQDVDAEKFDRDFRPMAAVADAPVVFYGTPWHAHSLLQQAKEHHLELQQRDGVQRHFRFDWETVAECVPAYGAYVSAERARLGERHPLFRTQYLLEVVDDADRLLDAAALAQLDGDHARLRSPRTGDRYVAGLDVGGAAREGAVGGPHDRTVLTIARVVRRVGALPHIEIVEHQQWEGAATEPLIETVADRLRRVWRVHALAVDATGLGGPIADLLASRLPHGVVDAVVFSAERKSQLGFALLAAVHGGRLRLYGADGSPERAHCLHELTLARVAYRDGRTMQFSVDPADGHDDYVMSLALAVAAAQRDGGARTARGHASPAAATSNNQTATRGVAP